ncbi:MAG: hypothetical protein OHK0036_18980 [Bacteroidia bacterium]
MRKEHILILAKTRMNTGVCVGGLILNQFENVRLLTENGDNQPHHTPFEIGQVYDIEFDYKKPTKLPHREDILVKKYILQSQSYSIKQIADFLKDNKLINTIGNIENLFSGKLKWTQNGTGYIPHNEQIQKSVEFWISDIDLFLHTKKYNNKESIYFYYNNAKRLKFVGLQTPLKTIKKGTVLRVSLSRLFKKDNIPEGYYLQLSGWYS